MIFYHGTAALHLAAIKKRGLVPHAGKGADTFAREVLHWSDRVMGEIGNRPAGVYITRNKHIADWYARMTAKINASRPVILEVDVPADSVARIVPDEEASHGGDITQLAFGGRWEGTIPPAWIVGRAPLETHPDPMPTHETALNLGYADE